MSNVAESTACRVSVRSYHSSARRIRAKKDVACIERAAYRARPSATGRIAYTTSTMTPAYDIAHLRALQPSRCGLHLRAYAFGMRLDRRARELLS